MTADSTRLPDEVADLLDRTLGDGGEPGILADWLDDHSTYWAPFAAALRLSAPMAEAKHHYAEFRFQPVTSGVMFWLSFTRYYIRGKTPPTEILLGVYRTGPGEPGAWRRTVINDNLPKEVRQRLWEAFGISDPTEAA